MLDCTKAGRWTEALWYLDRLIAARPDDWSLHEDRAAVCGKLGREADRQAELARVFELGADEGVVLPRAEEFGRAGRWTEAAALLARCGRTGPVSQQLAQAWGIACVSAGDRAGYRKACTAFMDRLGPDPVIWNALSSASLCALGAHGLDDYRLPTRWIDSRLTGGPARIPELKHYFSNLLGGLLLRAGRIDEAIARLHAGIATAKEAKGDQESRPDQGYLALAHLRKGDRSEARRWLERLRATPPDPRAAGFWDLAEVAVLQSEVEGLLFDDAFPADPFQGREPK